MGIQAERFAMTQKAIEEGRTVYFCTPLRIYEISPKVAARFRKAGLEPVVYAGEHIYLRSGKSLLCADYCRIAFSKEA